MSTPTPLSLAEERAFLNALTDDALAGRRIEDDAARRVLADDRLGLMGLLDAAFAVRREHFGMGVQVHILNNAQNGRCPEDCSYCSQAKTSDTDIEPYAMKREDEVLAEAERAYKAGAHRYCMVFSGRGPSEKRTEQLAGYVRSVKARYPGLEVCVSAGLLDDEKAKVLKDAGLDRLNHNLNTTRSRYAEICTTHTYQDRLDTLHAAKRQGLETCSGLIVGMGESDDELIELARSLGEIHSASIPVNFLMPFDGTPVGLPQNLTPQKCLRVLCLFRFLCPTSEVRAGAGREMHLRGMEAMCLYPANSLFLDGYLNGRGAERRRVYQLIADAGFELDADHGLDELLDDASDGAKDGPAYPLTVDGVNTAIKTEQELRPAKV